MYRKARALIIEKFGTVKSFSEHIGVSPSRMSKILLGKAVWPYELIMTCITELDVDEAEVGEIFFNPVVVKS